jgi:hypothetical protein
MFNATLQLGKWAEQEKKSSTRNSCKKNSDNNIKNISAKKSQSEVTQTLETESTRKNSLTGSLYPYIQRLVSFQYLAKNSPQLRVKYQYGYNCHTCCRIVSTQSSCLHWPCFYVWKVNILLCRLLYGIFYKKQGGALNKVRMVGALLCLAALLANTGIFSVNFFKSLGK